MIREVAAGLTPFESVKGVLAVALGIVIFVGSVYLVVSAVTGRVLGYLITAVGFFGMMIIFSVIFVIGVPGSTPPNQGPRGPEAHWVTVAAGEEISSPEFPDVAEYPGRPWQAPNDETRAEVEGVGTSIKEFLAERANEELGLTEDEAEEILSKGPSTDAVADTQFTVLNVKFLTVGDTELAAGQAYFTTGGPVVSAFAVFDRGRVPMFSWAFLIGSVILFAVHVPFLDRAERKRKEILTGGTAPPFLGPA
ncbi:MAG TPA: hypothetical protein VEO00_07545 [Actinomycetota bacterium]|nr:hypothetical protein [Actinomycetota bacterium]